MKKFKVTIQATVTKTIEVEVDETKLDADTSPEDEAYNLAHDEFNSDCDGTEEHYEEYTKNIEEIED